MLDRALDWFAYQAKEFDTDWRTPTVRVCFVFVLAAGVTVHALLRPTGVVTTVMVVVSVVIMLCVIAFNRRVRYAQEDIESDDD